MQLERRSRGGNDCEWQVDRRKKVLLLRHNKSETVKSPKRIAVSVGEHDTDARLAMGSGKDQSREK